MWLTDTPFIHNTHKTVSCQCPHPNVHYEFCAEFVVNILYQIIKKLTWFPMYSYDLNYKSNHKIIKEFIGNFYSQFIYTF